VAIQILPSSSSNNIFIEEEESRFGYQQSLNVSRFFSKQVIAAGIDAIDVFIPTKPSKELDVMALTSLKKAKISVMIGSANDMLESPVQDAQLLKENGILTIPDYRSNFGGAWRYRRLNKFLNLSRLRTLKVGFSTRPD